MDEFEFEDFLGLGGADEETSVVLDHDDGDVVVPCLVLLCAGEKFGFGIDVVFKCEERVRVDTFAFLLLVANDAIDDMLLFERKGVPKSLTVSPFAVVLGCR